MEPIREWIEDLIRRFMPENRMLRVLAAVLAAAGAILLLRGLRRLAGPALIGAILVVGGVVAARFDDHSALLDRGPGREEQHCCCRRLR